ncbi:PREDICTED: dehydrodolichyl diphosphate synthase 2 [Tarenaya hassleriana]|uniref:dehydrodolichyl diphosphate synthase 2 n=1 Tax=Tarenaya hassleriana TaxID=28532 RepID=UPI00053C3A03|nr:PREDICTED: dehydrodolichyl diphosphate synthase 2 [Tarenaya hassleriana]
MLSLRVPAPTNAFDLRPFLAGSVPRRRRREFSLSPALVVKRCEIRAAKTDVAVASAEEQLPDGLQSELMPKHVAVIMDGNGRWAKNRGLPASAGHQAGVNALRELVEICGRWGIQVLTVFAFSTDNWIRPKIEVNFLLSLFERSLKSELKTLAENNIRISIIGDTSKLPKSLLQVINEVEESTKDNTRLQLIVAVGYSGKYDVLQACRSIAQRVKDGEIEVDDIDESLIEQELETNCTEFPYPDLLIRTSGELRVSNFLLWQLAYTELFFAQDLWPDFGKSGFIEALKSFQQRQRRFGERKS